MIPKIMEEARSVALKNGIDAAKVYLADEISKVPIMKLDYYEICDADTLEPLTELVQGREAVSLIALFVGNIRLIDNWMIN